MGGLVDYSDQAEPQDGRYYAVDVGPTAPTSTPSRSHLDSFFEGSQWTREDVMVVAASIQIVMWLALLYVEVKYA
ncbi:hypothetical protein [Halapricum hydrolyticum]|uniref:Uncharacterized protein n=1 Tax=Halapricum hydrolyticum TaxID=2979991 RepID=A0AAE3I8W2_9EURY|nr:hypothetical protein [Halapricum hydrolyticum]MCU4716863.1 hypothetical protein [Halapricum hydrolyticum]MCU4725532.1 hypothetical protein [Halapricum hydrolyticum]